jgi:DNA-binding transcriptional MocR family regulator
MLDQHAPRPPGATLVGMVMDTIAGRIAARALAPGARLPSIRRLAATLGVSKSTVIEAYDRLAAEGAIIPRPGSGFYVAGPTRPLSLAEAGPRLDRAVDPLWVMRQSLEAGEATLMPGCGWLPAQWMPLDAIARALRRLARAGDAGLAGYDAPQGLLALRQRLSRRLADAGIEAAPDQVILTDSGTQAIDLLCRFLLEAGDTVLVDDPCYFNFQSILRAHRARVVGVPHTPAGPDLEAFARAAAEHRPRLYVTNAVLHNPTGASLSPATAHRILRIAEAQNMLVVEDDIFADFVQASAPRLAAFDGLSRVIHIGSFSKTLSAAVRCGYIVAPRGFIDGLTDLKLATTFGNSALSAQVVDQLLADGSYRRHMEAVRTRLAAARSETARRLARAGLTLWTVPSGGMFLWAMLPEGIDATAVARQALADNVVLAPGNVFSISGSAGRFLRFNVAQCAEPRIFAVLAAAMREAG